jgi:hypothetical protein
MKRTKKNMEIWKQLLKDVDEFTVTADSIGVIIGAPILRPAIVHFVKSALPLLPFQSAFTFTVDAKKEYYIYHNGTLEDLKKQGNHNHTIMSSGNIFTRDILLTTCHDDDVDDVSDLFDAFEENGIHVKDVLCLHSQKLIELYTLIYGKTEN